MIAHRMVTSDTLQTVNIIVAFLEVTFAPPCPLVPDFSPEHEKRGQ